jgi:hypothetical protein
MSINKAELELNTFKAKLKYGLAVLSFVAVLLSLQLILAPKANATTYNVTTSSTCTFFEALEAAATNLAVGTCAAGQSSPDTINVAAGTYNLASDIPAILNDGDLNIVGDNPLTTILNGAGFAGIVLQSSDPNVNYSISNLTFTGFNNAGTTGPPVLTTAAGNLTVNNIIAHTNNCTNGLPICSIFANFAPSGTTSTINVTNSTFYNNQASYMIWVSNVNAFLDPPVSGGSIVANFTNNTFSSNVGASIAVNNGSDSDSVQLNALNNTFADTSFTLPPGSPSTAGGMVMIAPDLPTDYYPAEIKLKNNVFSNNLASGNPINCQITIPPNGGTITSLGGNISSDNTCSSYFTNTNDLNNTDPQLQALTQLGTTFVRPIGNTSPAYNNAIATGAPSTDQRGVSRPQNGAYDSGAFEYVGPAPSGGSGSNASLASTGWDTKIPSLVAGLLLFSGLMITGYSIKRRA